MEPMNLTESFAARFAQAWYGAWNSRDVGAIMALYAAEIEHSSPFIKRYNNSDESSLRGLEAVRDYFALALERNPTLSFHPRHLAIGLQSVVLVYARMNGDLAAEAFWFNSQGKIVRSISHYELAEG